MDTAHLVFYLRTARCKAREAAIAEALCLLRDLDPAAPSGGPLSERGKLFWVDVPTDALAQVQSRLPRLGYTVAVDLLEPAQPAAPARRAGQVVRWRGKHYNLSRIYEEDPEAMRERAPDRRLFQLETGDGQVRAIRGYRGDGGLLSKRGFPVCDARLLVNLVFAPGAGRVLLDPFAGVGGIILEAIAGGCRIVSADIDPALRYGCRVLGACHSVADAIHLPFGAGMVDAIATEPPYHRETEGWIVGALTEMGRVLKVGGRLAVMCAGWQAGMLRQMGAPLGLRPFLDTPINRKGTDCVVLAWERIDIG